MMSRLVTTFRLKFAIWEPDKGQWLGFEVCIEHGVLQVRIQGPQVPGYGPRSMAELQRASNIYDDSGFQRTGRRSLKKEFEKRLNATEQCCFHTQQQAGQAELVRTWQSGLSLWSVATICI